MFVFFNLPPFPSPTPLTLDYGLAYVRDRGLYMDVLSVASPPPENIPLIRIVTKIY